MMNHAKFLFVAHYLPVIKNLIRSRKIRQKFGLGNKWLKSDYAQLTLAVGRALFKGEID